MSERDEELKREHVVASGDAETVNHESARRTRRSFLVGGVAAAAGAGAAYWVNNSKSVGRLQDGLRKTLNFNADVNRTVWDERGLAPTYARSQAVPLRLNGTIGLEDEIVPESWRLQLVGVRNAASSPLYVKDVTAWNYEYAGGLQASPQALDVKSAPGNGINSKTGAPKNQKSSGKDSGQGGAEERVCGAGSRPEDAAEREGRGWKSDRAEPDGSGGQPGRRCAGRAD